jgi:hypothetical protein
MRVASGLDSLMLGEPQILGQVKSALALSKDAQTVSPELNSVFEYAFYAAKRVRSETSVGSHAVSMGYAVAQLALQVFSRPEKLTVMVVAAGEMNSLVAKHLAEMGVAKILICNRSRERADLLAQEIAHQVEVEIIPFAELAQGIYRAFLRYKREHEIRINGSSRTVIPKDIEDDTTKAITAAADSSKKDSSSRASQNQEVKQEQKVEQERKAEKAVVPLVETNAATKDEIIFKIQILTSSSSLKSTDKRFKGLKDVEYYQEGGLYKYTYGASADYNKVLRTKRSISTDFKDAFIIAFKEGKKMDVNAAISEFKKNRK